MNNTFDDGTCNTLIGHIRQCEHTTSNYIALGATGLFILCLIIIVIVFVLYILPMMASKYNKDLFWGEYDKSFKSWFNGFVRMLGFGTGGLIAVLFLSLIGHFILG